MSDEQTVCPRCGAPLLHGVCPLGESYLSASGKGSRTTHCDYAASLRSERDEARKEGLHWIRESDLHRRERDEARDVAEAEHTYASIVKAENESMRRVVEAALAFRLHVGTDVPLDPLFDAVDVYRKEQQGE